MAASLLLACSASHDPPPRRTTTTTESTAPPTTQSSEQQIEARFAEFVDVMGELSSEPNPDDERLAQLLAEPMLSETRTVLAERKAANQAFRRSPDTKSDVLSITDHHDGTATAIVCSVGADQLIDRDTGQPVGPPGTSTLRDEVSFHLEDGRWMVYRYATVDSWDGIRSCE